VGAPFDRPLRALGDGGQCESYITCKYHGRELALYKRVECGNHVSSASFFVNARSRVLRRRLRRVWGL